MAPSATGFGENLISPFNTAGCGQVRTELRLNRVTEPASRRSSGVNEAIVEPIVRLPAERSAGEQFEALYRTTFPRVYAYVASMLRDRSAAEEVTAQAYERAYRKRSSYKSGRGTPEAWLFGIARHAALDELRRLKRRAPLDGDPEDVSASAPEDHAEGVVRRETVRAGLATLDPRERDLLALKFQAGLSNSEIARVLVTSESNVGTKLHRTMEKLRRACNERS
jgi:RNA polymerase sigma-70 factor (ECF subfamily)